MKRFSFTGPKNTEEKSYNIEAIVTFDDGDEINSEFKSLTVERCEEGIVPGETLNVLSLQQRSFSPDGAFSVPVTLTNPTNKREMFSLDVSNADWATFSDSTKLTLNAGQSSTVYLYVDPVKDISGRRSATVNVKLGDNIVDSDTIVADFVERKEVRFVPIDIPFSFWVFAYIVIILMFVYFIKLIFRR